MINKWHTKFLNGSTDLNDDVCACRLNIIDENTINTIHWFLEQDVQLEAFLIPYNAEGEDLFDRIFTDDEKRVYHFTLKWKWIRSSGSIMERASKKAKMGRSAKKVYLACFWDCEGILLEEYVPKGVTTIKETYFDILMHLRGAIKMK